MKPVHIHPWTAPFSGTGMAWDSGPTAGFNDARADNMPEHVVSWTLTWRAAHGYGIHYTVEIGDLGTCLVG